MEQRILNGWKEISSHLERGTRTAQRWEIQFGMPVHRPASKPRTAVVAFAEEIDAWLIRNRSALNGELKNGSDEADPARLRETLLRLQAEAKELAAKLSHLERHLEETANSDGKKPLRGDALAEVQG
jgi:phage terminase Nu1 subunit (DNA packaging protein)